MSETRKNGLTDEELAAQQGNILPDREEMSIINPNSPLPWDPSTAPPVVSDDPATAVVPTQTPPLS